MKTMKIVPPMQAILAAILFGASTPLSKVLLGEMDSIVLASLLYLGSGLGITLWVASQKYFTHQESTEAKIRRADVPWLIGAIVAGGVVAPIILLLGLRNSSATSASLLLNFEGVATTLIAALVFKEAVGKRTVYAIILITLACVLLSLTSTANWTFSLMLALFLGKSIPDVPKILLTLLLGFICYGLSTVLFILALRNLGAARTSTFFGVAPFAGMLISIAIFRELPQSLFFYSVPLMLIGAWLMLGEHHHHPHIHQLLEHEHSHSHPDDHHAHEQLHAEPFIGEHSHKHGHEVIEHSHTHSPDLHHRHQHQS